MRHLRLVEGLLDRLRRVDLRYEIHVAHDVAVVVQLHVLHAWAVLFRFVFVHLLNLIIYNFQELNSYKFEKFLEKLR